MIVNMAGREIVSYNLCDGHEMILAKASKEYPICQATKEYAVCASSSASDVELVNLKTGKTKKLPVDESACATSSIHISGDNVFYVSMMEPSVEGESGINNMNHLTKYNIKTGEHETLLLGEFVQDQETPDLNSVLINDQYLALLGDNFSTFQKEILIVDCETMTKKSDFSSRDEVVSIAATSDEAAQLASVSSEGEISFWDINGECVRSCSIPKRGPMNEIEVLDSEKLAYFTSNPDRENQNQIAIFDMNEGKMLNQFSLGIETEVPVRANMQIKEHNLAVALVQDPSGRGIFNLYHIK